MADLKITELAALAGVDLAAGDLLPIADISASETKKITVTDFFGNASTLIANATIPGAKILFSAGQIAGSSIATGGISATQLGSGAVTAAKLANESTVDLVTTLPASGAYTGQLALDTDDLKVYCWDGSVWRSIKAAGSINTVNGDTTGVINIEITTSGDTVTVAATLDNTSGAAQFLAGPTGAAGAVGYRAIVGTDLPTAGSATKGGVTVNGEGLRVDGTLLEIDNDVTASGTAHLVTYSAKGLVTSGRTIVSTDLPAATSNTKGAVQPGTGLAVDGSGILNHSNTATAGTYPKVIIDAQGHVTSGTTLVADDIPNLPASKITSGTLSANLLGTNSVTGAKLANYATVKFGGAGSTAGVVTFPTADYTGQQFFDSTNGDLYLYDGNTWQPITVISGDLVYAGTYNAATNQVKSVTTQGSAAGFTANAALPAASATNVRYYVVVSDSGTGTSPAPAVALAPPDMLVSNGTTYDLVDVSNAIAGQTAGNISFTPYGGIVATNVQTALQELDDEKLSGAGGVVSGSLLIGSAATFGFEGSTADAYETYLAVVDPTADRTITFPDASGTVVLSGAIVNADIAAGAAIADTKLATISTAGKVSNSATTATNANTASAIVARDASGNFSAGTITATFSGSGASLTNLPAGQLSGTIPSAVLGNSNVFLGTTSVALNRSSANQALTGISSIALPGSTSGTITIQPTATAGSNTITFPAATGTLITTGDTGTVTDTMLATISTAGKVSGGAITSGTIGGSTAINTSGAIATTSTLAVGQSSAAANTELDLAGTYAQTVVAVGALNIDCSTGNYFTKTINGASTFTVSNVPASRAYAFTLELTHTSGTVTWFSGVEWPAGTAPTLTTGKTHLFMFVTDDGGTRWRASSLINYTN